MNKTDSRHIGILISVLLLWSGMLFFCVYGHYQQEMAKLEADRALQIERVEAVRQFEREHGSTEDYRARLDTGRKLLEDKLPQDMDEAGFMQAVSRAAVSSGVKLTAMVSEQQESGHGLPEGLSKQALRVSVQGDFFSVLSFLRSLNAQPRFFTVQTGRAESENTIISLDTSLQIYSYTYNR